jgi:hypothetical protein
VDSRARRTKLTSVRACRTRLTAPDANADSPIGRFFSFPEYRSIRHGDAGPSIERAFGEAELRDGPATGAARAQVTARALVTTE